MSGSIYYIKLTFINQRKIKFELYLGDYSHYKTITILTNPL